MCPTGYECVSVLKGLRVGVVGLLKKKKKKEFMLKLKKISKIGNKCNSSEIVDILMNHSSTTAHSSFIVHLPAPMSYFATSFC